MKLLIYGGLLSLLLSFVLGLIVIPILRKIKAGQPILKYVKEHADKNGTPTMGGLFFITSAIIVFAVLGGFSERIATVSAVIGLAYMAVGFLDDFIKIKLKHNEGLKAYQKVGFQIIIASIAGIFSFKNGITEFYIPFTAKSIDFGVFTIPFVAFIFIAITNSVNLTDGIDGLAGSVSVVYLIFIVALINVQAGIINYGQVELLSVCLIGATLGFLIFNQSKAKVFMGDTGSLSLGGFIGAISIFTSNSMFIPVIGIMFVLSSISVIIQVIYYKKTKKRVFLMAPLHHHFQLKGRTETQITYCYTLITALMGMLSLIAYL